MVSLIFASSIFFIVFCLVIAVFATVFLRSAKEWKNNKNSPLLTVPATVVAKRAHTTHSGTNGNYSSFTHYYATFQVESGDRMELSVPGTEYGFLVEGDYGKLSFQGTRFRGFERI